MQIGKITAFKINEHEFHIHYYHQRMNCSPNLLCIAKQNETQKALDRSAGLEKIIK